MEIAGENAAGVELSRPGVAGRTREVSKPKFQFLGRDVDLITVKEFLMQQLFFSQIRGRYIKFLPLGKHHVIKMYSL